MLNLLSYWKPIVEIIILWFVYYRIMLFFQGTRAIQVLRGIIILVFAFFIFQVLHLETLDWLLTHLFGISIIGILILFQPEIRHGLARLGQRKLFKTVLHEEEIETLLKEVIKATETLSKSKTGALIVFEKEDHLKSFIESGVKLDSKISSELIETIFSNNTPLHDGGIVIEQDRITAAGCFFPLTDKPDLSRILGTRHRAAIGLTEQTDAVVLIVSEETGSISVCSSGKLLRDISLDELFLNLKNNYKTKKR